MVLTYEKIREIQRKEQASRELQALPKNFMKDFEEYIRHKEKLKKKEEVENAKFVFRDIINRRERKVVTAAMEFVRTSIEPENLSTKEKGLFNELVSLLKKYREGNIAEVKEKKPEEERPEEAEEMKEDASPETKTKTAPRTVNKDMILIKIKEDLPDFVGPNLTIYSLRKKEIANLPRRIGELLVKKGLAEEVE